MNGLVMIFLTKRLFTQTAMTMLHWAIEVQMLWICQR